MICKNCGKEYDMAMGTCPHCDGVNEDGAMLRDEDLGEIDRLLGFTDGEENREDSEDTPEAENKEKPPVKTVPTVEHKAQATPVKVKKVQPKAPAKAQPTVKAQPKSSTPRKAKETATEKQAKTFIICIVSFMAVLLAIVSVVGLTTDAFKQEDSKKAVALLGLSFQEEGEFETYLESVSPIIQKGFDSESTSAEKLLELLSVGNKESLYATLGGKASLIEDEADPAGRYGVVDEMLAPTADRYAYYKISATELDEIFARFALEADHTVNTENFYYYRDAYYFRPTEGDDTISSGLKFDIKESKRIQDGGYYIVCSVLNATDTEAMRAYIIAEKTESSWVITKVTHEPMFDTLGIMVSGDDKVYSYEMKREVIESKRKDGSVYCRYVLEYPLFSGESVGELAINTLYQSLISAYKAEADKADKEYKQYIEKNSDEDLPRQVYIRGEVTYNKEKYVSVVNEIAQSPVTSKANEETGETEVITLSQRSYEGYVFDMASGEFVGKDAILGKDYLKIAELLYRIDGGYDYTSVLNGTGDTSLVPKDEDERGLRFYEGASALCEEGYAFYTADERGIAERVVIPYDTQGIFSERF